MRLTFLLAALGAGALSALATTSDAHACGGCFHPPTQSGDVITDHRMIFRVTPQTTTLYDEIEYQGNPASFAWVLPIRGPVTVGLSSDIVFSALDTQTAPTIIAPNLPACASCFCGDVPGTAANGGGSSSGGLDADAGAVNVISQQTVGPYATVQLQSTDPMALDNWLSQNGYSIPTDVQPIVAAYVNEGFDFLAMKLQPGQSVTAMRPVRITSAGAGLQLPLRMVAAGTGATVGITLWVLGDGRYEPQNFQIFTIAGSDLTWDWSTNQSNYTTVRSQKEAALNNAAWQIESAIQLSPDQIEGPILEDPADMDYLAVPASDAGSDSGAGETADEVRDQDLTALFPGGDTGSVWVTRIRSDLAHAALANDLVLQASASQTELSNQYQVTTSINAPTCPAVPDPCPPCDTGGSSGSGPFGSTGGPPFGATSGNGGGGSGCSTAVNDPYGDNFGIVLAGFVVVAIAANRGGRRRRS